MSYNCWGHTEPKSAPWRIRVYQDGPWCNCEVYVGATVVGMAMAHFKVAAVRSALWDARNRMPQIRSQLRGSL